MCKKRKSRWRPAEFPSFLGELLLDKIKGESRGGHVDSITRGVKVEVRDWLAGLDLVRLYGEDAFLKCPLAEKLFWADRALHCVSAVRLNRHLRGLKVLHEHRVLSLICFVRLECRRLQRGHVDLPSAQNAVFQGGFGLRAP